MRGIAICGREVTSPDPIDVVEIDGLVVRCGLVPLPDVELDPSLPEHHERVLVRKTAVSCHYRDKAHILGLAASGDDDAFVVIGSEFVGEVVDRGREVTGLEVGDRVIADASYPGSGAAGIPGGIATEHGSRELEIFHPAKLLKIPRQMPDTVAAAMPIGAQTTYSMIRRLDLKAGEDVLVTSAKSNTSLFAINVLKCLDVNVYATSTSQRFADELRQMGVRELVRIDPDVGDFAEQAELRAIASACGGFDAVIDPFCDLHLSGVLGVMAFGGRYVTCGLCHQSPHVTGTKAANASWNGRGVLTTLIRKNLHLIGNCLGDTADLQRAVDDYANGGFEVVIDSVFRGHQVGAFLERTYNFCDRLGKVVYEFD